MDQISLFETNKALEFHVSYRNENLGYVFRNDCKEKNIIKGYTETLTKQELINICKTAQKEKRSGYAICIFYEDQEARKGIIVRFINFIPKKKETVFEVIDKYFDVVAEIYGVDK